MLLEEFTDQPLSRAQDISIMPVLADDSQELDQESKGQKPCKH